MTELYCPTMVSSPCLVARHGIWGTLGGGVLCSHCVLTPVPDSTISQKESFPSLEETFLHSRILESLFLESSHGFGAAIVLRDNKLNGLRVFLPFPLSRPTTEAIISRVIHGYLLSWGDLGKGGN